MNRRELFSFGLCIVLTPLAAVGQNDLSDSQIRAAIRRGMQFLKSQQHAGGNWDYPGHEVGITALAGLALAENAVSVDDPSLKKAHEFVRASAPYNLQTYDISLAILFLVKMGDAGDRELILQLGQRLAAGQLTSGGWTYLCPQVVPARPPAASVTNNPRGKSDPPRKAGRIAAVGGGAGFGDNSNTQFAALGIWAAGRKGLDVTETMAALDRRFRSTQSQSGGWGYTNIGDSDAMTCAGLMSLVLTKGQKTLEGQMVNKRPEKDALEGPGGRPRMDSDKQIDRGILRVEAYVNNINPGSSLYFLWSVERVGVALGLARIGRVDWYSRGAAVILQNQQADGSWHVGRGSLPDTSFALLFLRRSNLTEGMPQLVTGRSSDSGESRMRAGKLEDLIQTVRPPAKAEDK